MRILYLSQYFPPEVGATQTRGYEMARNLVRLGHEVTVLTELPNHPAGITFPDYRERHIVRRDLEGIDVIHSWVWATPTKTMRTRLAFYLSYMLSAIVSGLLVARGRYDVIYCTSPPLFVGGGEWSSDVPPSPDSRVSWLRKPFGINEFRRVLEGLLNPATSP